MDFGLDCLDEGRDTGETEVECGAAILDLHDRGSLEPTYSKSRPSLKSTITQNLYQSYLLIEIKVNIVFVSLAIV